MKVIDDTNIQVIVGTEVQFVADEMQRLYNHQAPATPVKETPVSQPVVEKSTSFNKRN